MRRTAMVAVALLAVAMIAGTASASASTLSLAVSPTINEGGSLKATISARGTADPNIFGSDELDVFTAPTSSTCAGSAEQEDQNLGFPGFDTATYPGFAFVQGSFSQSIIFDSGSSTGGSYLVCGYLSEGNMFGTTDATAQASAVLMPVAPVNPLKLSVSASTDAAGYPVETVTASGNADPTSYDTLDVFVVGAGSRCAPTSTNEDDQVAPAPGSATFPISGYAVQSQFSQSYKLDPHATADGSYGSHTVCGYLTSLYGATDATAATNFTLAPPPPAIGSLHLHLSTHKVKRGGRVVVKMRGSLSWTALPATLVVYVESPPCDVAHEFTDSGAIYGYSFRTVLKHAGEFHRSFASRFGKHDYGGTFTACAYLGRPDDRPDWDFSDAVLYARVRTDFAYEGLPQPRQRPTKLTQLERVQNAVTKAIPNSGIYASNSYSVQSCRKSGPHSWSCVVESTTPGLPVLVTTVREINGRYYVGEFHSAA